MKKGYKELLIRILEDIGEGNTPKYNKYSISEECFWSILNYIKSKDFARGMSVIKRFKANRTKEAGCMNPYLTMNGVNYLNKNV